MIIIFCTSFTSIFWVSQVNAEIQTRVVQEKSLIESYIQFSEISNLMVVGDEFPLDAYDKLEYDISLIGDYHSNYLFSEELKQLISHIL